MIILWWAFLQWSRRRSHLSWLASGGRWSVSLIVGAYLLRVASFGLGSCHGMVSLLDLVCFCCTSSSSSPVSGSTRTLRPRRSLVRVSIPFLISIVSFFLFQPWSFLVSSKSLMSVELSFLSDSIASCWISRRSRTHSPNSKKLPPLRCQWVLAMMMSVVVVIRGCH